MKHLIILAIILAIPLGTAYAQTGVNVDGSWYLGEGLKKGDYFEYTLCEIDLNGCEPIELRIWIKGDTTNVSETLWDAQILVIDADKTLKGSMGLGKTVPIPILFDEDMSDYAIAFKSSIAWISAFATSNEKDRIHGPQEFSKPSWGSLGPVGGGLESELSPSRVDSIILNNTPTESIIVGWYNDNDNEIWLVDGFPFPVKALTYAGINSDSVPKMFEFNLTQYKENVTINPFENIAETVQKSESLKCDKDFTDYTSGRISTNTYSMMVQYNFSPEIPIEGCEIDWKINFYSKYNDIEILDQVNYDIWVVDENNNKLYSYAESVGKDKFFTEFGQVEHRIPVEVDAGTVRYAVFVHGLGPQDQVSNELSGYAIVEVQVDKNPLLSGTPKIPEWIKNNASWWADGQIDDVTFIQGIQFLIKEGTITVESTTEKSAESKDVPAWIKNNAKWWADGSIDEDTFIQGIEYLVKQGIILV